MEDVLESPTSAAPSHPITTSRVSPLIGQVRGTTAHEHAVNRLLSSFRALPRGSGVRLAKPTSNLFRPRLPATGPGLDVAGLDGVISIDPATATADVQGMCTYEQLVATTLRKGLMPLVVPQLRTITLGGAVTGLGIESTSFRNGLPHESVLECDVLTGAGELVTAAPQGPHAELYRAFPNSYGTLGYAVRLRIRLEPVHPYVALRNLRFDSLDRLLATVSDIMATGSDQGVRVDFLDGVVFSPHDAYLVVGHWADDASPAPSDYTGQAVYYRSIRSRASDLLTVHDYLWRWDTDWFWCSRAFGAQHPVLRRLWPTRYRRSDVYHRILGLENRYHVAARIDAWRGKPARERVIQDVEVPLGRAGDFLRWFFNHVPLTPVWLCPLRLLGGPAGSDESRPWPLYPMRVGEEYVNIGFWGTVAVEDGGSDGDVNRLVERAVADAGGHKSLYSQAYYDEADFWAWYGGETYLKAKQRYDPDGRLLDLYAKAVGRH